MHRVALFWLHGVSLRHVGVVSLREISFSRSSSAVRVRARTQRATTIDYSRRPSTAIGLLSDASSFLFTGLRLLSSEGGVS